MKLQQLIYAAFLAAPFAAHAELSSGIDKSNFDPSVRIQDNIYKAVNGGWEKRTEIPADQTRWGAFLELRDLSEQRVRTLVEGAGKQANDANARQIAALYASFMNEAQVEKLGIEPLKPWLAKVDAINSQADLVKVLGALQQQGVRLPLNIGVGLDAKDSSRYLLGARQGGLGVPDRDYYLVDDPRFVKAREAYLNYLTSLFTLAGSKKEAAASQAAAVVALETRLAKLQWSRVENRDPQKTYNKMDRAGLKALTPNLDWTAFLEAAGASAASEVDIGQPTYFKALDGMLGSESLAVWKDYLRARVLDHFAPVLPSAFVEASFAYHDQALAGAKENRPRWKRGVALVEANLGESVGKLYAAQYFPASAKARMEELVGNLMKAYGQSIDKLGWMSPATKAAAKEKLAHYGVKIGYPNKWRDYSALTLNSDDLFGNFVRGAQFAHRFDLARLGKPVDRDEWFITPQTVNAYYSAEMNEIVFPAAILQPPFFNASADDAVNYGGIGSVIGHEISHGFDDQGSQFDARGNLRNWWQEDDRKAFSSVTERLVTQYDQYMPIPNRHVNGKLTLGENIADLSGLQIAYKAYQLSLGDKPAKVMDGFTGEQRFFIGFSQVWRSKVREERALQMLSSDVHAPSEFRPIGAAVNSDAFVAAFGVKPGDGMFKPEQERIRIW
ncbi:M13 family metallopeptidase [Chitinimonas sp.]|uniref:M13 family metallopeptidase n=1 Tax=Chitinimonas sp. TaxID=1934313 RepID=UPI0035AECBD5